MTFWGFFSGNKSLKGLFSVASKKRKQLLLLTSIYIQKLRRKKNSAVSKKPRLILKHQKSWKKPHKSCHFTIYCEDFFLQTQQYPKKKQWYWQNLFLFWKRSLFFSFFFHQLQTLHSAPFRVWSWWKRKKTVIASKKEKGFDSDHVVFWIQLSLQKKIFTVLSWKGILMCFFQLFWCFCINFCFLDTAKFFFSLFSIPSLKKKVFFVYGFV